MSLSDLVDFRLDFALGLTSDTGSLWDTALWDTGTWSASTLAWQDYTQWVEGFNTKMGKQALLKRFRTGTARVVFDNSNGLFTPQGGQTAPGALTLRPGRLVRISARAKDGFIPAFNIPDGTTWVGETGRTWEANGTGLRWNQGDEGWVPLWYGVINTIQNRHRAGNLTAVVDCIDALGQFAIDQQATVTAEGAGDLAGARVHRILDYYGWPSGLRDVDAGVNTMQATTMARRMGDELGITADSDNGDLFVNASNEVVYRQQGWLDGKTVADADWALGGAVGIPVKAVTPAWDLQRIISEVHAARDNGTEQVVNDPTSIARFGRRTHTRLDLICETDGEVLSWANRVLAARSTDEMVITGATIQAQDSQTVEFMLNVSPGDTLLIQVDTIHGWSSQYLCVVIGIADECTADDWLMYLTLENAIVDNTLGPYSYLEFDDSYSLGGQPEAVL